MDVDADPPNAWQTQNAYFNATHTRVYEFKTLVLFTYHHVMSKMVWLAGMEIQTENTTDITFFCLFNPRFFVWDESGVNYNAIQHIYGEEYCNTWVRGCQFHFKSDVRKMANIHWDM